MSTDSLCCFGCGQTGHTVKKCPRKAADKPTEDTSAAAEADTAAAEGLTPDGQTPSAAIGQESHVEAQGQH